MLNARNFALSLTAFALLLACQGSEAGNTTAGQAATQATVAGNTTAGQAMAWATVTVQSVTGAHEFKVDIARTKTEQARGLMFRTGIPADGGMLFAPYPADGGGPREASFWMRDTPSPLDIIFIRADGTIAHIAENTVPFSDDEVKSGEPVAAVLEINGGRSAELGISPGDKVNWR